MPKRRGGEECVPSHCRSSDSERFIRPCEGPWFLSTTIARIVLEQMIAQRHQTAWTHPMLQWACVAMGPPGRLHGDSLLVLAVSPTPSSAVCFEGSCVGLVWLEGCILASTRSLARTPPLRSAAHLRRVPEPTHARPPGSCTTCAPSMGTTRVHTTRLGALWFHPVVSPWDAHNPPPEKGGIGCGTPGSPSPKRGAFGVPEVGPDTPEGVGIDAHLQRTSAPFFATMEGCERDERPSFVVCGSVFDVGKEYAPMKPIGKGAYGVVWYEANRRFGQEGEPRSRDEWRGNGARAKRLRSAWRSKADDGMRRGGMEARRCIGRRRKPWPSRRLDKCSKTHWMPSERSEKSRC